MSNRKKQNVEVNPQIQMLPTDSLSPYWRNPRDNAKSVEVVMKSIKDFGFQVPIVVDQNHVIITGHTRHKAATKLGLVTVPCIVANLSQAKAKAFRIADNKAGEQSEWNMDALMKELRELGSEEMQAFFHDMDIEKELAKLTGGATSDGPTQEEINKTTVREHQRFNGSSAPDLIDVTCPHCLQIFGIRKDEFGKK